MSTKRLFIRAALTMTVAFVPMHSFASSHREAPLITEDPTVDATDLYAFRNGNNVVIVANYIPFELPSGGPNFHRFSDNAAYRINIDNTGDARPDVVYEFRFRTTVAHGDTFLYNTGPIPTAGNLNVRQLMTVTRQVGTAAPTVVLADAEVAPAYVGRTSYGIAPPPAIAPAPPLTGRLSAGQNAAANAAYDAYVSANDLHAFTGGATGQVFAGPRDDPFFVDLGATFDLLRVRPILSTPANFGNQGGGVDHVAGWNVHSIVIEVPITQLTAGGVMPTDVGAQNAILGIWTTAYRQRVQVIRGSVREYHGQLVQVSRLATPLVNEVLVPLAFKDFFNNSLPQDDVANYGAALTNNEVTRLLNGLYLDALGTHADVAMVGGNLVTLLSAGLIRGATPMGSITPADVLHLNVATAGMPFPTPGSAASLGVVGGDSAGFPNGRRLSDDVVDVELRVLAGALANRAGMAPNNALGDGVYQNDAPFSMSFPYLARPWEGFAQNEGEVNPANTAR